MARGCAKRRSGTHMPGTIGNNRQRRICTRQKEEIVKPASKDQPWSGIASPKRRTPLSISGGLGMSDYAALIRRTQSRLATA